METSTLRKTLLHTALLTTITSAQAQLYFDVNAATAGSGTPATAAWNTGTNWSTAPAGDVATVGWTNGQAAIFSAGTEAAGTWTVNVTGTVQTNSITFNGATNSTVHNIAGGTIDMGTGGLALNASAAGVTTGRSKTISSAIIGSGGLTIAANGDTSATGGGSNTIFALSGTNTFLGNTTITSGMVGYTSNFGDASNNVILDGGGIVFNTTGNFTRNLQIGTSGGILRNYGAATSTLTGSLSGTGDIHRTDGGTSIYAGNGSAFTGYLFVDRGTFQAGNGVVTANPVANIANINLGDSGGAGTMRYQFDGSFTLATPIAFGNTGSVLAWQGTDAGDVMTINNEFGVANNIGTLRANSGAITLASGADVLVGTVSLTSTPANSATAVIGTMNIQAGSVLETGFMNIGDGSNSSGIVNQTGGTVTIATGGSGFRIGHWTNGTLTPGSVYNLSGGTLDVSAENLVMNVGWDGAATLNVSGGVAKAWRLYVDAAGVDAPGIVNLTGGSIEVGAGGILNDGTTGSQLNLGGGTLKAVSGGTWASLMNANASTTSVIDVNGSAISSTGGFTGTGSVSINDTAGFGIFELNQATGTRTITPSLGGTTELRKSGLGTVVLAGNNTHTGTLYHDFGTLSLTGTNAFSLIDINDSSTFSGEGSTTGAVSLGFSSGATLSVNPTTPGAFHAGGGLTLNGVSTIALSAPFSGTTNLITYSGTLTGNSSNLTLPGIENYRSASINFTPGAISLTSNNANLTWTGTGGGVWDFNTTAGWSGGGSSFYWGDTVHFDDTSAVTSVTITGELAPNLITVDANTNAYTFTGSAGNFISGIGSLLKTGSSALTINAPNTFSGGTVLSNGSIVMTGIDGGLGTGTVTLGNAATGSSPISLLIGPGRNLANPITVSSLATGSVTIGQAASGGFTQFTGPIALQRDVTLSSFNNTDRLHFGGVISGTGSLTINGGKRITMSGNNTFSGGSVLIRDAGTIFQNFGGNPVPDTATVDVGTDSIFQVYTSETIGSLVGSGILQPVAGKPTLTLGGTNSSTTFSGTWRPQGSDHLNITKTGTGTLTLSGPIASPGSLTVNGGVVELTGTGTFGRTQAAGTALPTRAIQGSGIVRTSGSSDITLRRASTGFTGSFQINGGVTTVGHSAALATQAVSINGGTLRFDNSGTNFTPLANSVLTGGTLTTDVTTKTLSTLHNATGDAVPGTTTHVYHGFIYLTAGQWSFGENFDDGASVTVAGTTLFNDGVYNAVTTGTFSAPDDGWYAIDVRVYQGAGAAGGVGDWATAGIGVGIKTGGTSTNVADYVALADGALGTRLIISNSYSFSNAITLAGPATIDTSTMVGQPGIPGADGNGTGGDVTLTGIVSGTGSLTKAGAGTLLLNAANTYTGDTRVDGGRLTLATANLANGADVYIASGAVLNLTHAAADTVRSLYINGVGLAPGTYNATSHPGIITGSGSLLVTTAGASSGFDSWASTNGVSGGTGDPDGDGIANAIEFVIGGDPSGPNSESSSLLPTASSDPDYLTVVYRRSDASMTMAAAQQPYVEYGSSLTSGSWTKAQNGTSGVIITSDNDFFGTGFDRVTVKIPRTLAAGAKLFARLRADIP